MDRKLFNQTREFLAHKYMVNLNFGKDFSPRLEGEVTNTRVLPATLTSSLDPGQHEWAWGAFIGLKKVYRFYKNIKGTALIMIRVFNPDHKSPYVDVLSVRIGFEFSDKEKSAS